MVKSDSHIDVLFREGLSKLEVLPPASLWENIQPVLRKRKNKGLFFKIAAGIALLTSLGLMAYFYATTVLNANQVQSVAFAGNGLSTLFDPSYINITVDDLQTEPVLENQSIPLASAERSLPDSDNNITPGQIIYLQNVELPYERLDNSVLRYNNALRYNDVPDEVPARSNTETLFASEILPVEPVNAEKRDKRWELGAMISPTYLSTSLKTANQTLSQVQNNENAVLSYTGGLSLSYSMTRRLSIQTGIYYSSLGREVQGVTSYSGFEPFASSKSGRIFGVTTSSGTINSVNSDIYLSDMAGNRIDGYYSVDNFDPLKSNLVPFGDQLRQNFEYLEIPLIVSYKLIDRKLDFNILGGMSYNFLVGNQTWAMNKSGSKVLIGSTEGIDHLLLSSSLGMSMEYELSERFLLNLEPQVRYYLNTGGDLGSGNPYTFGVFSGMHFRF
ncbi:MAG: outer membrane beta-barrel protein [Bacteroidales bacterium]|nr:outer membrane beta-barrel protein [Bacteroidales bacterium]